MPVLSENAVARVGYAGSDKDMGVRILGEWERGEITMVMSASSGPKDYVKNLIAMALDAKVKIGENSVPGRENPHALRRVQNLRTVLCVPGARALVRLFGQRSSFQGDCAASVSRGHKSRFSGANLMVRGSTCPSIR